MTSHDRRLTVNVTGSCECVDKCLLVCQEYCGWNRKDWFPILCQRGRQQAPIECLRLEETKNFTYAPTYEVIQFFEKCGACDPKSFLLKLLRAKIIIKFVLKLTNCSGGKRKRKLLNSNFFFKLVLGTNFPKSVEIMSHWFQAQNRK